MLRCSGNSRSPALGSGRNFPPGQIGTGPRGFFAFLCSTEHDHLSGLLCSLHLAWLTACCSCTTQMASRALQLRGGRLFFPHAGLARVSGGFLPSSAALSTAPSQGSSEPLLPTSRLLFWPLAPPRCHSCPASLSLSCL